MVITPYALEYLRERRKDDANKVHSEALERTALHPG